MPPMSGMPPPAPPSSGLSTMTASVVRNSAAIDAAKVTRSALQNAASIAALFLTTEAVIVDKPEEGGMGGGMPDMGGMDF